MNRLPFAEAAERVKSGLDIVEIIQRYVPLKRFGRDYRGLCPFHKDTSPSMDVNREKGVFLCRSCGIGGGALNFLMRIENRTYGEVIKELADSQGIEITYEQSAEELLRQDSKQKLLELNLEASQWFHHQFSLPEHKSVQSYLNKRYPAKSLQDKVLKDFNLGYAPPGWENLTLHLKSKFDFILSNSNVLVGAGLAKPRENGKGHYDCFRDRLIIPIHNERGQVVAFGGRALSDEDKPKYLNSPETEIYKKSHLLYGLYQAKDAIRKLRSAVVVEGYFDVITAHAAGITEAVGSCGTALTDSHLKLLTRSGTETLYLAFDSDQAGIKAALKAIQLIEPNIAHYNLELRVLVVPDGKDPDEFIRQHGGEAFRTLMAQSSDFLGFKLDMAIKDIPVDTPEGRIEAANRITPHLAGIKQLAKREEYIKHYANQTRLSEDTLEAEVNRYIKALNPSFHNPKRDSSFYKGKKAISGNSSTSFRGKQSLVADSVSDLKSRLSSSQQIVAEKNLLKLLLYSTESFYLMLSVLEAQAASSQAFLSFDDPIHQEILEGLRGLAKEPSATKTDPSGNGFLGTLIEKMNHLYFDKPDVLHTFAELALTAESFCDSLGLGEIKGTVFQEKVSLLAKQQLSLLARGRMLQQLQQLKTSASQNEGEQVELTYQFQDRLFADTRPPQAQG